jgi:hypothetical protein
MQGKIEALAVTAMALVLVILLIEPIVKAAGQSITNQAELISRTHS